MKTYQEKTNDPARYPDPITHAPDSHPVGTGIGAAAGGATGAAIGSPAGPAGTVAGAAVGAILGGLAGKGIAEEIDPRAEDRYWRENFNARRYVAHGARYEEYAPAYRYGWETYGHHAGRRFEEVESDLQKDWDKAKGKSTLAWDHAKHAVRDAWDRLTNKNQKS